MGKLSYLKVQLLFGELNRFFEHFFEIGDVTLHDTVDPKTGKQLPIVIVTDKQLSIRRDVANDVEHLKVILGYILPQFTLRKTLPNNKLKLKIDMLNYWSALLSTQTIAPKIDKELFEEYGITVASDFTQYMESLKEFARISLEEPELLHEQDIPIRPLRKEEAQRVLNALKDIPRIENDLNWIDIIDKLIPDEQIEELLANGQASEGTVVSYIQTTMTQVLQVENSVGSESLADSIGKMAENYGTGKGTDTDGVQDTARAQNKRVYIPLRVVLHNEVTPDLKIRTKKFRYPYPAKGSIFSKSIINVILDTSGSISPTALNIFTTIIKQLNNYVGIRVFQIDTKIHNVKFYQQGTFKKIQEYKVIGRGGTVFRELERAQKQYPSKVWIFLTDGIAEFPQKLNGKKIVFLYSDTVGLSFHSIPKDYTVYRIVADKYCISVR